MSNKNQNSDKKQHGFTLIEAVIAIFIVSIALIGTAAAITFALQFTTLSRNVSEAKTIIVTSIEEIETLRNSQRLEFKQIENAGAVNNTNTSSVFNGFSVGFKDVSVNPGPDGVGGTDDDLRAPGVDSTYGTPDDFDDNSWARTGFRRQITITQLSDTLKKVEIKVHYFGASGGIGELTGVCYLNDETRTRS